MAQSPSLSARLDEKTLRQVQQIERESGSPISVCGAQGLQQFAFTPLAIVFGCIASVALIVTMQYGLYLRAIGMIVLAAYFSGKPTRMVSVGPGVVTLWKSSLFGGRTPTLVSRHHHDALHLGKWTSIADHPKIKLSPEARVSLRHALNQLNASGVESEPQR